MIRKIELLNFKCFVDSKFEMNQLTVLAGANATGKSSVIQSILLQEEALERQKAGTVDKISMLKYPVGSLKGLVAHHRDEMDMGDMRIKIAYDSDVTDVIYTLNRDNGISLTAELVSVSSASINRPVYLQAERMGARTSYPAEGEEAFQPDGCNAPFIISNANNNGRGVHRDLAIAGVDAKIEIQFQDWMSAILGDMQISLDTDAAKASTDIRYMNGVADEWVYPPFTGFGISYAEPIVAAGLWCSMAKDAILIVENPEAHLHPSAQSRMGKFLSIVAMSGTQVIVETHSEHVIDGIRLQAALMKQTDRVNVLFFRTRKDWNESGVETISVNQNGELDRWPEGFFDQKTLDLRELFDMRRE